MKKHLTPLEAAMKLKSSVSDILDVTTVSIQFRIFKDSDYSLGATVFYIDENEKETNYTAVIYNHNSDLSFSALLIETIAQANYAKSKFLKVEQQLLIF